MVEILAPAGSPESFYAAINGGANAVYLGLDIFSARKNAVNFTRENLPFYIKIAHILGVKVYVALNTIVSDSELPVFFDYAAFCNSNGVDAVIIQDMLLGKTLKKMFPELELHLSTQAGVNNIQGAITAKEYGFSRVVLARETPVDDIKKIAKIIETEIFVQGALCTAFSGQCYLSGFAGNNSGNRGLCKQPCRKFYTIKNSKTEKHGYNISLADLSLGGKVKDLYLSGVTSFKIEGRMRKPAYVYYAAKYYSDIFAGKSPSISPLSRTFKRGNYTCGLGFGQDANLISDKVQSHIGEVIGKVTAIKGTKLSINTQHIFAPSDSGKILRNGKEVANYTVAKNGDKVFQGKPEIGDTVTITTDTALEALPITTATLPITVTAHLVSGQKMQLTATANNITHIVYSDFTLEKATNAPLTVDDIKNNLLKCGNLPFSPVVSVETDGVFVQKSLFNALRRTLYDGLADKLAPVPQKSAFQFDFIPPLAAEKKSLAIIDENFSAISSYNFDIAVFAPKDYSDTFAFERFFDLLKNHPSKKYLYLPGKLSDADNRLIAPLFEKFDGLYVDGFYGINFASNLNKPVILGTGTNIYNKVSAAEALNVVNDFVVSKELTKLQADKIGSGFYYSAGAIKVMDLCYCPFGKKCSECKGEDLSILSDGERDFILRRVKLNGCRFEVYNCANLLTEGANKQIVNFITLTEKQKLAILDNIVCPINAKHVFGAYTTGHYKKPLE